MTTLQDAKLPSLKDKLLEQERLEKETKAELQEAPQEEETKVVTKKRKKKNEK